MPFLDKTGLSHLWTHITALVNEKNTNAKSYTDTQITNHTQAASSVSAGTFAGAVVAPRSSQTYSTYMLRNSRLASSDTNPSYNGEICWTYE